jgi:hypothetical protein
MAFILLSHCSTPIRRDSKNAFSDFDPTIQCDNTKEGYNSLNTSPTKTLRNSGSNNAFFNDMPPPPTTPTFGIDNEQASQCPVRLAAKAVLSHLVRGRISLNLIQMETCKVCGCLISGKPSFPLSNGGWSCQPFKYCE